MSDVQRLNGFERCLTLITRVQPGEGRCVGLLSLQAFALMVAYYLIRPVREALILTEGTAELRSYAVGAQALLLILIIPLYALLVRRVGSNRVFQYVIAFFALNLVGFYLAGRAGWHFSFAFFVWASIFAVMAVAQFWAFATDLFEVNCGTRLFGVIAVGVAGGAWVGATAAAAGFEALGPYGLMLASAGVLCIALYLSERARHSVPAASRGLAPELTVTPRRTDDAAGRWLGGIAVIGRSRYLVGIAALVVLLNWITATGDFVLSSWLVDVAHEQAPQNETAYIGKFMGRYCSTITLIGFLIQLLLVSRIINAAGIARALMITPIAFLAGYFVIGILPVFALLQSALIIQKSLDYSLLNTTRSALLLPTSREEKYQAKTAIDTLFYRLGDLLSTVGVFIGLRIVDDARLQFVWLMVLLSATMILVAWLIGREYSRRYCAGGKSLRSDSVPIGSRNAALAQ